jgi:hypothetical protein
MFGKAKVGPQAAVVVVFCCAVLMGQQTPPPQTSAQQTQASSQWNELPAIMRQNVNAGGTPVGTKVEAKLLASTLINGAVVPQGAILSGEVTESAAKSKTEPSHLGIRMDSAQWKNGTVPVKLYLTAWYYPMATMAEQNLSYEPPDAARSPKNWNGAGTYPDPNNPASQPFPGREGAAQDSTTPASPASNISKRRVLMKNIETTTAGSDGAVALTSTHGTIKLDKITTYVFATGDIPSRK